MAASTTGRDDSSFQFRLITATPKLAELTGAVDLLSYYGTKDLHDKFCQKSLPVLTGGNQYLKDVVGDIDIWKGEDMELGQLIGAANEPVSLHFHQFDDGVLQLAFSLRESGPTYLPEIERGIPTSTNNLRSRSKEKHRNRKLKNQHKDREKDRGMDNHNDRDIEEEKIWGKDEEKDNGNDHSRKHRKVMLFSAKHMNAVLGIALLTVMMYGVIITIEEEAWRKGI